MTIRPNIRCIAQNGNHEPSPFMRDIYGHRDRIEGRIRALHHGDCGRTTAQLLGVTYAELLDRAHRHLVDVVLPRQWSDPIL